jgi:hypothetical protein
MIQRRQHLRFAMKAREPIGVGCKCGRQNLQRDVTIELRIARAVDLTHAACTNGGDDFVWSEATAGTERHTLQ